MFRQWPHSLQWKWWHYLTISFRIANLLALSLPLGLGITDVCHNKAQYKNFPPQSYFLITLRSMNLKD